MKTNTTEIGQDLPTGTLKDVLDELPLFLGLVFVANVAATATIAGKLTRRLIGHSLEAAVR